LKKIASRSPHCEASCFRGTQGACLTPDLE
jgi:hypothetical protein